MKRFLYALLGTLVAAQLVAGPGQMLLLANKATAGGGGGGGPTLLVSTTAGGVNGGTSASIDTTGANLIVVLLSYYVDNGSSSISDSKGNSWSVTNFVNSNIGVGIYYCVAPTVGTGHTFSVSGTNNHALISVAAFSGFSGSPVDGNAFNSAGGGWTTITSGSITPSQANCVFFSGISLSQAATITPPAGFTIIQTQQQTFSTAFGHSFYYKVLSDTSAVNPSWSTDTSQNGRGASATFKF